VTSDPAAIPPIRRAILDALQQGDKTQGELFDLTQCRSYPVLNVHLKDLIDERQIEAYFTDPPQSHLTYRLRVEAGRPLFLAWYRPN
jgi:hypothetical protein